MRMLIILFLVFSFLKAESIYAGEPEWPLWGYLNCQKYDAQRHVYVNASMQSETWFRISSSELKKKMKMGAEEVPEKKKTIVVFQVCIKPEQYVVGLLGTRRIRPFFVHCKQDGEYDARFDTILMPNGTVAVLNSITDQLRNQYDFLESGIAIDESYLAPNAQGREREILLRFLRNEIEHALSKGEEPVVFATMLSYNAEGTLELLRVLKEEFCSKIRTGVGGQLVRVIPETYRSFSFVDHVGVGDAEIILEPLLIGKKETATAYLRVDPRAGIYYAPFAYDNYLGLQDRLEEMSRYQLGPFSNMRQLVSESVRGCAWAHSTRKACEMCSLESIDSTPHFRPIPECFAFENQYAEKFGVNWIFDASSQFLPVIGADTQEQWLREYVKARREYGAYEVNKYVYLTANSITEKTAPLIREAGIRIAYIGLDGWDNATRKELHKPQADFRKILTLCRDNDLYVRTSLVIGAGLNERNIQELPKFAESVIKESQGMILSWGNFLQIILPGSAAWDELRREAIKNQWKEAQALYQFFKQNGFLTWPQQERMTELYIRHIQKADYDAVVDAQQQAEKAVKPYTIPITIRGGGQLNKT